MVGRPNFNTIQLSLLRYYTRQNKYLNIFELNPHGDYQRNGQVLQYKETLKDRSDTTHNEIKKEKRYIDTPKSQFLNRFPPETQSYKRGN